VSSFFFERPLTLLACGIGLEVALGLAIWLTGRAALWRAMLAVLVLTLLAIGIERLVVTDREQIDALLDRGVQAVLAHDMPGVLATLDPGAAELRRTVTQMLARGRVEELKITHQEVAVRSGESPRTATVHLIARIKAQLPAMSSPQGLLPVLLALRKTDGWKIIQADFEPRALPKAVGS
jgi:hypothetical protein